jgi:hypothetical protein
MFGTYYFKIEMAEFLKIMYHLVPKLFKINYCKCQKMKKKQELRVMLALLAY